jgi:replication factor A1
MFKLPYEQIVAAIMQKSGLPETEVELKIRDKLRHLSGLISKEGAAHIVANELGVKLLEPFSGKLQIKNIMPGMRDVETAGQVLSKYEVRSFNTGARSGKVGSLMIGDETGSIRVVMWGDQTDNIAKMNEGDVVSIVSGYVRENLGRKELHVNEKSKVILNPEGVKITATATSSSFSPSSRPAAVRKEIKDLTGQDANVEILGTLVQLFEPRFFEVCKSCGKRAKLMDGMATCPEHGPGVADYSYVMNGMLDDGTENIRVVFFREQANMLLSMGTADILMYKDNPSTFETKKTELLGTIIKLTGKATQNQMFNRLEFVARGVDLNPDPKAEMARLENSS